MKYKYYYIVDDYIKKILLLIETATETASVLLSTSTSSEYLDEVSAPQVSGVTEPLVLHHPMPPPQRTESWLQQQPQPQTSE